MENKLKGNTVDWSSAGEWTTRSKKDVKKFFSVDLLQLSLYLDFFLASLMKNIARAAVRDRKHSRDTE